MIEKIIPVNSKIVYHSTRWITSSCFLKSLFVSSVFQSTFSEPQFCVGSDFHFLLKSSSPPYKPGTFTKTIIDHQNILLKTYFSRISPNLFLIFLIECSISDLVILLQLFIVSKCLQSFAVSLAK